jgi:hypothetical protein
MGRPSKRATKIRQGAEFTGKMMKMALEKPRQNSNVYAWRLPEIYAARNAQMNGQFALASKLRDATKTDDAILVGYTNRLAPVRCIQKNICPANDTVPAKRVASEAEALFGKKGIAISSATESDIVGCLADHGVAFAVADWVPRPDGSRVDVVVRYFPIEFVRWDSFKQCYVARLDTIAANDGVYEVEIKHGDGRWIIFAKHEHEPWKTGALASIPLVWAGHAFAAKAWSKGADSHGSAKMIGELPPGMVLQNDDGTLTAEAEAFIEMLRAFVSDDSPCGIRPAGSKTEFVANASNAWQVYSELMLNREKAAARIYQGTDALLGAQGGAPGVDISAMFGVATTLVQGDVQALERGFREGVIEVWCALNFGDSSLAPLREYLMPDVDADAARESMNKRVVQFQTEIEKHKSLGFELTQEWLDERAKAYDVPAPKLPVALPAPSNPAPGVAA